MKGDDMTDNASSSLHVRTDQVTGYGSARYGTCAPTGDPARDARRQCDVVAATKAHRAIARAHVKGRTERYEKNSL